MGPRRSSRRACAPQGDVGTAEDWLTELLTAELTELFALQKEAVAR